MIRDGPQLVRHSEKLLYQCWYGGGDILRIIPLISGKHPDPDTRTCGTTGRSSSRIIRHRMKTSATVAVEFYVPRFVRTITQRNRPLFFFVYRKFRSSQFLISGLPISRVLCMFQSTLFIVIILMDSSSMYLGFQVNFDTI